MLATKKQLTVLKSEMSSVLADMFHDLDNGIDDINVRLYGIDEDIYELNEFKNDMEYYDLEDIDNNKYEIECLKDAVTELEDKNERLEEEINELHNKIDILTKAIEELLKNK